MTLRISNGAKCAGRGNRTPVSTLGRSHHTTKLYPLDFFLLYFRNPYLQGHSLQTLFLYGAGPTWQNLLPLWLGHARTSRRGFLLEYQTFFLKDFLYSVQKLDPSCL